MTESQTIIPIEDNRVYFLFRRGKNENIKALYDEGEIYINSIDFIRTCDNNEERTDKDEGIFFRNLLEKQKLRYVKLVKTLKKMGSGWIQPI